MNTIREAIDVGTGKHLGPVKVGKDLGIKASGKLRMIVVSDDSGEIMLKIWGNKQARTALAEGDILEIKTAGDDGNIKYEENEHGKALNVNKGIITVSPQGNAPSSTGGKAEPKRGASNGAAKGRMSASMRKLIIYGMKAVKFAEKKAADEGITWSGELAAGVFGSAMYGFKEGRPLVAPEEMQQPPAPAPEPEPPAADPEDEDEDDIPF